MSLTTLMRVHLYVLVAPGASVQLRPSSGVHPSMVAPSTGSAPALASGVAAVSDLQAASAIRTTRTAFIRRIIGVPGGGANRLAPRRPAARGDDSHGMLATWRSCATSSSS